jgi:uncharacterized membrane protein
MGEKVILILVSLFFGLMPLWMGYVINPRWAAKPQRTIIAVLIGLNVLFYGFLFFGSSAASFKDLLSSSTSIMLVVAFWIILIVRANQLWPR